MKKLFIIALPFFMACNTATNKTEPATPAASTTEEKTTTQQEEEKPVVTQASYDPKLQAVKWDGIKELTDASFKSDVLASSTITLVDFNATWCGPCKMQKPILDKLVKEYKGKINFASVDVDVCPKTAAEYSISSIPTMAFYKDAKQSSSTVGLTSYEDLKAMIDKQLK